MGHGSWAWAWRWGLGGGNLGDIFDRGIGHSTNRAGLESMARVFVDDDNDDKVSLKSRWRRECLSGISRWWAVGAYLDQNFPRSRRTLRAHTIHRAVQESKSSANARKLPLLLCTANARMSQEKR